MEIQSTAKLVDVAAPGVTERGITATVSRSEIEETLRSAEGPAELFLDVARVRNGGHEKPDVEAHTLKVEWEKQDLEELLQRTRGDAIPLRFDRTELELALEEADVEAHGLREKALVLSVAAVTAAGISGQAAARVDPAGGAGTASASAPISDVVSGGPAGAQAASETPLVSDVVSGGPAPSSATAEPSGGGGISVSAPEAWEAGLAGGLTLLITGASFAARRQRRRPAPA